MKKLLIIIFIAAATSIFTNNTEYVEIPSSSIRMRVIAKDDTEESQKEKVIIKSALEEQLYSLTENAKTPEEVDTVLTENKVAIDNTIEEVIKENKYDLTFTSNYGLNYFPEKEFKGVTYKSGNYNSYVVTLGEGKGENWWCVLFPPLCQIDENTDNYEYRSLIKDTIFKYN